MILLGFSPSILLVTKSSILLVTKTVLEFKWLNIEVRKTIQVNLIKDFSASVSEKRILEY